MAEDRSVEALDRRLRDWGGHVPEEAGCRRDDHVPLDELLAIAEKDLRKNQEAFAETARLIDPKAHGHAGARESTGRLPAAAKLLSTTQGELDALGRFMSDQHLITIPKAAPAVVQETPPFLRATSSASMDIPGPFETVATEAYYNMTLPEPKLSAKDSASS